jgi:small subunit ribosomal protein S24e
MSQSKKIVKTTKIDDKKILFIENERLNKLINRLEIVVRIEHVGEGTPSRELVKDVLAKLYSIDKDLVVIRRIDTSYGRGSSKILARIYKDPETLRKFEPEHILKRGSSKTESKG